MRPTYRYGVAVVIAVILSSLSLAPLTTDRSFLRLGITLVLLLGAVTMVLRRQNLRDGFVIGGQFLTLVVYLLGISLALGGEGSWPGSLGRLYSDALHHLQTQAAPMPPNPGVTMLLVTSIGLITILTHILVESVDRPAWGILPLLTLFLIPALGLKQDISGWYLIAIGVGYLLILFAEGITRADDWSRNLSNTQDRAARSWPYATRLAALIAVPTLALTFVLGSITPLPGQVGWNFNRPKGNEGPLQLSDPTLDLRRNLSRPEDRVVISYTSDNPRGQYLRLASLSKFDSNGWQIVPMQLQSHNTLPQAPGLTTPGRKTTTAITIADFPSEYLPAPYAPTQLHAGAGWSFDPISLTVLATGEKRAQQTVNLRYSVNSVDVEPDGTRLSSAAPGRPPDAQFTTALPPDLPPELFDLTLKITKNAKSPALKAAAIQKYLRSDEFTYSLEPQPGSGYTALTNFLLKDKTGYCEQFAASMAMMARVVGIPSRVSVGFLPGKQVSNHWEVSLHNMHAWPELYFEGEGWVRFEPTPSVQTGSAPPWTVEGQSPERPATTPPTAAPTAAVEPSATPTPTPSPAAHATSTPEEPAGASGSTLPWGRIGLAILVVLILVALAAIPGLLRMRLRTKRLGPHEDPHEAVAQSWAEVRDSLTDVGRTWLPVSPRAQAKHWAAQVPAEAAAALTTLARMVEKSRYGRSFYPPAEGELLELVTTFRTGLLGQEARDARIAANWWPRSVLTRIRKRLRRK